MSSERTVEIPTCILTTHGGRRLAQHKLNTESLFAAECYGRRGRYQPGGVDVWRIDRRIVRQFEHSVPHIARLNGVTMVASSEGVVITAYKNKKGNRLLRKQIRPGRGHNARRHGGW